MNQQTNNRRAFKSASNANSGVHWGGAYHPGYFQPPPPPSISITIEIEYLFAMVTDLDQLSRVSTSKKTLFYSNLLGAILK